MSTQSHTPRRPERITHFLEQKIEVVHRRIWTNWLGKTFGDIVDYFAHPQKWWISNFLYYLLKLLLQVWTTVLLLVVLAFMLTQLDQAKDYFEDFDNKPLSTILFSYVAVFSCGIVTWYGTRLQFLLFDLSSILKSGVKKGYDERFFDVDANNANKITSSFIKFTPPILGSVSFLILLTGFAMAGKGMHVTATLILLMIFWGLIGPIKDYIRDDLPKNQSFEDDSDKVTERIFFADLKPQFRLTTYAIWFICIVFFIITAWFQPVLVTSRLLGMIAIAFLAFSVWIWILSFINILNNHFTTAIHLFLVFVFIAAFVYPNNNNHSIRVLDAISDDSYIPKKLNDTLLINNYFHNWLHDLTEADSMRLKNATKKNIADSSTTHVYLVAAEGGGIRAAYWTAGVLAELEKAMNLTPRILAISGVSGGSVGAGFYVNLYQNLRTVRNNTQYDQLTKQFMERDYLSPLLAAGLGPDLLQKLLFFKVPNFDRAQYLEDSWDSDYEKLIRNELERVDSPPQKANRFLKNAFNSHWMKANGNLVFGAPVLFLNSTNVDRGQKAIITPLRLDRNEYFKDVIDIQEQVRRPIPMKVAMSMSARFPGFTPPAVVNDPSETTRPIGHYVDGGYGDNSGLETTIGILSTILEDHYKNSNKPGVVPETLKDKGHLHGKVKMHVIFIKNSAQVSDSVATVSNSFQIHSLYELTDPIRTFFNTWDNSLRPKIALAQEFLRNASYKARGTKVELDEHLYILELDRDTGRIPLGWQLSRKAVDLMCRQLSLLSKQKDFILLQKSREKKPQLKTPIPADSTGKSSPPLSVSKGKLKSVDTTANKTTRMQTL